MSDVDRAEPADSVGASLVAVTPKQWARKRPLTRPDPTFLAQLIANAEQVPQARRLRRATPADAQLAYSPRRPPSRTGSKTTQVI